jgi:hypothetical protein
MSSADIRVPRAWLSLAAACGVSFALAAPAAAQAREPLPLVESIAIAAAANFGAPPPAVRTAPIVPARPVVTLAPAERPRPLLPLYGSFGALQAMDAHSTLRAVRNGAVERNPLIAPLSSNPGAMFAVKAATTAGTIVLAERLWRRHPGKAVGVMVAANIAYAAIVAANYRK